MVLVRRLDRHATARDVVGELLELGNALAHGLPDGRRSVAIVKDDLKRDLHERSSSHGFDSSVGPAGSQSP
jgi:hypothetical protein